MRGLSTNDLDWFAARLSLAVYDTNRESPEMSIYELRQALRDIPGIETLTVEHRLFCTLLHIDGRTLQVSPGASNEEIRLALQNPFVRTENTKMSITNIKPGEVKGLLQKVRDRQAASLAKVASLAAKSEEVAAKMDAVTSTADKELDTALAELGQFSNLGPDLNAS